VFQPSGDANLTYEPIDPQIGRQLWAQHLESYVAIVLEVTRLVDERHTASAALLDDVVAALEGRVETLLDIGHRAPCGGDTLEYEEPQCRRQCAGGWCGVRSLGQGPSLTHSKAKGPRIARALALYRSV